VSKIEDVWNKKPLYVPILEINNADASSIVIENNDF
jgi:hypothetical protein